MSGLQVALHRLALRRLTGCPALIGDRVCYRPEAGQSLGTGTVHAMTGGGLLVVRFDSVAGSRLVTPALIAVGGVQCFQP